MTFHQLPKSKMSDNELLNALRFMIAAEIEAQEVYTQLTEASDNPRILAVLNEIADEKRMHAAKLLRLIIVMGRNCESLDRQSEGTLAELADAIAEKHRELGVL